MKNKNCGLLFLLLIAPQCSEAMNLKAILGNLNTRNTAIALGVGVLAATALAAKWTFNYFRDPATLADAAKTGNLWKLRAGIFLRAPLNSSVSLEAGLYPTTPLMHAAKYNQPNALEILLKNGAPVDTQGNTDQTALAEAVWENNVTCAKILLEYGANPNASSCAYAGNKTPALYFAANNTNMLNLLIKHKATIDHGCIIEEVIHSPNKQSFAVILEAIKNDNKHLATTFLEIYKSRHDKREEYFAQALKHLDNKKDVLNFALYALCGFIQAPIDRANQLIEKGADVNALHKTKAHGNQTPLQRAVYYHNMPLVKVLLGNGARVNTPGQISLLNSDFENSNASMAIALLEAGIDLDCQDEDGNTALIKLARYDIGRDVRFKLIKLLIFLGADHTLRARTFLCDREKNAEQYLEDWSTRYDRFNEDEPIKKEWLKCIEILNDPRKINNYLTPPEEHQEFSEILKKRQVSLNKIYAHNANVIRGNLSHPGYTDSTQKGPLEITAEYLTEAIE